MSTEKKELLLEQIDSAVHFRTMKASEYPDDKRNLSGAVALEEAGEFLAQFPADHEVFTVAFAMDTEALNHFLSRWGFYNDVTVKDSVFGFVHALIREAEKHPRHAHGRY